MRSMECTLRSIGSIFLILAVLPLVGCASAFQALLTEDLIDPVRTREYSAEAISGRVVDAETKQPIQGMVAVAYWRLLGGLEGGNILGAVQVLEAVTDQEGRFNVPAWGPMRYTGRGSMEPEAPAVLFYKRGYVAFARANTEPEFYGVRPPYGRTWRWNGRTHEARNHKGDPEQIRHSLRVVDSNLSFVRNFPRQCVWKQVPRTLLESLAEETNLKSRGVFPWDGLATTIFSNDEYYRKIGCGSPVDFVKDSRP